MLELQRKATKTSKKANAKTLVVIAFCRFGLVPAVFDFALETQRAAAATEGIPATFAGRTGQKLYSAHPYSEASQHDLPIAIAARRASYLIHRKREP